jgi:hypothetical protein
LLFNPFPRFDVATDQLRPSFAEEDEHTHNNRARIIEKQFA